MIPLCLDQGVGLTPYSPLAKGRATRPWGEQTARSSADAVATAFDREADKPVVDAIHRIADARSVPMAQIAPGLGAVEAGGVLPHRRCHQTQTPRGRRGRPGRQAHRGRD
jgi:predicted transcriptional regulator